MNKPDQARTKPDRATTVALLMSFADTTWRMFVPSVLFIGGGIYGDLHWGTEPWLTLASVALGLIVSTRLIKDQIKKL